MENGELKIEHKLEEAAHAKAGEEEEEPLLVAEGIGAVAAARLRIDVKKFIYVEQASVKKETHLAVKHQVQHDGLILGVVSTLFELTAERIDDLATLVEVDRFLAVGDSPTLVDGHHDRHNGVGSVMKDELTNIECPIGYNAIVLVVGLDIEECPSEEARLMMQRRGKGFCPIGNVDKT